VRTKRVWAGIVAGFLLLILTFPQSALAAPAAITLSRDSGYCGDSIEATATVDLAGTYRVCWNSRAPANVEGTFTTTGAGNYTVEFTVPLTVKGTYIVYLTREDYSQLATSNFTVIPFVNIEPDAGPVGTVVGFSGNGFAASQDIQVSLLGAASTTKTSTAGTWALNYTIPATPAGAYTFDVEFKEGTVWYDLVGKSFKVTPQITAPSSGKVGQTIEVQGTGFASDEEGIQVTFTRQGTSQEVVAKQGISADEHGSWEATVVVPVVQGGTYAIGASGTVTRARDVPAVSFTVTAGILVEPNSAYVGDTITVTGGGFAPGETGVRVTFDGQSEASGITAHSDGTWESSFILPPSAYGPHTASASGDITPAVTATVSTQARIEDFSPVEGAPGDSVSLTGSGFPSSQPLTVTIGGVAASGDLRTLSNGNVAINFRVPKGSVPGRQALVVSDGSGATASAYFTVTEKILATPQPISPRNGATLRSGEVTFQWGAITGGGNVTYTLQISDSPDLATYVRSISDLQTASYTVPEDEPLLKGTYYWWVRAEDSYGNESPYSDSSKFNVSPIPTWVWVVIGVVIFLVLMVVAYRETKFRVTE
jgi:hypothetical protein